MRAALERTLILRPMSQSVPAPVASSHEDDFCIDAASFADLTLGAAMDLMGVVPLLNDSDVIDLDGLDDADIRGAA